MDFWSTVCSELRVLVPVIRPGPNDNITGDDARIDCIPIIERARQEQNSNLKV
jgi:hypothetical protein